MNDADVLRRLEERGLELPAPPEPVASYAPVTVPIVDGQLLHPGRLGTSVSVEMGQEAAALAALQALSALRHHLGGRLDRVARIAQVTVFMAADVEFIEHPKVANGASDLLVDLLGPEGRHARAAVGVASLPLGSSVELVMTAELSADRV